ncbi:hypothetical protein AVEN_199984-1 [Araneus ventricosus]|uniref:Uncharacterized protein n=1 Tax=Araneus ventricosus TaxID=182803 RepID=A0A4Y2BX26_ARAVE|nr:hypothetical protein AVEN_199984-1 [Araneus ventricosus]
MNYIRIQPFFVTGYRTVHRGLLLDRGEWKLGQRMIHSPYRTPFRGFATWTINPLISLLARIAHPLPVPPGNRYRTHPPAWDSNGPTLAHLLPLAGGHGVAEFLIIFFCKFYKF